MDQRKNATNPGYVPKRVTPLKNWKRIAFEKNNKLAKEHLLKVAKTTALSENGIIYPQKKIH